MLANLFLYIGLLLIAAAVYFTARGTLTTVNTSARAFKLSAIGTFAASITSLVYALHLAGLLTVA
jgi:hypothetical protein